MEKIKAMTVLEAFVQSFCVSTAILNSAPAAAQQANVGPCAGLLASGLWFGPPARMREIMSSVLRISTVMVVVFALVAGLRGPRVFASTRIATDAGTDREALVALYEATDGDSWVNSENWLTDASLGSWYGVTIDDRGRVIDLVLSYNGLSGTIPARLGNLIDLRKLYLRGNELSGEIPPELGKLASLKEMSLADNVLSGEIPPELGNLANLRELTLWGNQLSGSIPPELGSLVSLEVLDLSLSGDNKLSGSIPPELGNLVSLREMSLPDNALSGEIPPELGKLTNLESLHLGGNQLSGEIPPELGKLTNLHELLLWDNELSGSIPSELGDLINLQVLSLPSNELSGSIPPELGDLAKLRSLYLSSNALSGQIPSELGKLSRLAFLNISDNRLSHPIPSELGNLNGLRQLDLSGNQLSGSIPPELGNLANLKELYLSGNRLTGEIPSELSNLIHLEGISLAGNQLHGCMPAAWRNLRNYGFSRNDLDRAGLLFCVSSFSTPAPAAEIAADKAALVALYQSTDGDNWLNSLNWLSDAPIGTWLGVTTDDSGRVIKISLSQHGLQGTIPPALGDLTHLESLDLSDNQLRGEIPRTLGNLTNLESLDLWTNRLRGKIPPELGNLKNLKSMDLADNELRGEIPAELGNLGLSTLYWLDLRGNRLSGEFALELSSLANLSGLFLEQYSENNFIGCMPAAWEEIEESDVFAIPLPFCAASSPTPTAVAETYTRTKIFEKVSPAIAFIQTEIGSGSGVLIEEGYVVTNAHVVWPFDAARVVFPDGTEFGRVPVKGWDLLTDLAVLGPIDAPAQAATLLDGESIPIGSDMYLIGYPGEVEYFPQPTIAEGTLSRLRQWEPIGVTYLQADAPTAGGQSGGAHVSESGDVVGISSFWFIEGEFSLAASSADILPRIRQLIAGEDPSDLGERRLPLQGGVRRHELTLQSFGDAYLLNAPVGTAIEVELSGADEGGFRVFDSLGYEITKDETDSLSFDTEYNGPHFLVVSKSGSGKLTLIANRPLARFDDPDDNQRIQVGQSLHGNIDFPRDIDFFSLRLERNETVEIVARSVLADTLLSIWDPIAEEWASDDDGGGGLFGEDARIIFQAPQTGEYDLFVVDAAWSAPGGYVISVKQAGETEPLTSLASSGTPTRPAPVVSIHNALVIPIGDTPTVSAGDIHEWFPAGYEPPTGPTVTINGTMNVRGGPGTNYPITGAATAGQQYAALSRNAAGDWWQIEYEGRLAWVYGGLVTASADAANAPQADRAGWLTYENEARGLSVSLPSEWRYFDPAQPSQADLALFSAARKGDEEQLDIAEMGAMVSAMSAGSEDAVVGLGLQADQANDASSNFMLVFAFAAGGMSLEGYVQVVADRLQDSYGVEADSVELVPELRPLGEEAVSIRYRESETNSEVWQVWLLSPDEERLLALAFSVHSDEFAELEPLVREIVQKAQWANQPAPTFPVVTVNGNMNVRGGPGTFYPVLGTASTGEQFAITGKNPSGAWWRINYNEQPGWVFSQLVTASGPLEDVPLVKAYDWDAFHDGERRLWIFYPPGWFFFDPTQPSEADRRSLADMIGAENAEDFLRDFSADMDSEDMETFVGYGFETRWKFGGHIESTIHPSGGLALRQLVPILENGLREAGLDVESAGAVTNLRYDGAEVVSVFFRDNRAGLDSNEIRWQVWMLSPDRASFLRVEFTFRSEGLAELVPLLSEMVRRIRWE